MSDEKKPDPVKVFGECHVELRKEGDQLRGDCPFCDKPRHLFVDAVSGRWDCKKCGETGNIFTFIRRWYETLSLDAGDVSDLVKVRPGIGSNVLKASDIRRDDDSWIVPSYMMKDGVPKIRSLRRWTADPKKMASFPTLKTGIYIARLDTADTPVWITEGEWDALALLRLLKASDVPGSVVAFPGCNTFPANDLAWIVGRKVNIIFDHDEPEERKGKVIRPGFDGINKAIDKLNAMGVSDISVCGWGEYEPPMDIRDLSRLHFKEPEKGFAIIDRQLMSVEEFRTHAGYANGASSSSAEGTKLPDYVDDFDVVMNEFRRFYEVTDMFERSIACAFACFVSNRLKGDQLWMFLVGPPSSGKTTIIEAFGKADKYTIHLSKLTSQALVSGMNQGGDPSILPKTRNKMMMVKDFTAVLALPPGVQEELFGMLRDAYDRNVRVVYGNGTVREYRDLNFTVFAGCTDEIYTKNHSSLGERFLKLEILDPTFTPSMQARAALLGTNANILLDDLQTKVYGYCRHLADMQLPDMETDDETVNWLVSLANIVAYLRAGVRKTQGNLSYRPRPEVPARLALQFQKLYRALRLVAPNKTHDWTKFTVEKVAMDTCIGWALEFVVPILRAESGISTQEIADMQQVSPNHVRGVLRDLQELGVVESHLGSNNSGRSGRMKNYWVPNPDFLDLWTEAGISIKATRKFSPSRKAKRNRS